MPSWEFIRDMALPALFYMVLPALAAAALVMAAVDRLGGARQAAAGAAVALCAGAFCGLWVNGLQKGSLEATFIALTRELKWTEVLTAFDNALQLNRSSWNRLPWAILAALVVGRLAHISDVLASDGWLVRGGAAIVIAWLLLPENDREEIVWLAPAFAVIMAALWIVLDSAAAQPGSGSTAVCVILSLLVGAQIMLHAQSARLMDALVVLTFAFTGIALVAFRRGVEFRGAIPAIAVALPALLLMGQRTASAQLKLPWFVFALPAFAPLVLAVTLPLTRWPKPLLHVVRLVLVLAVLGVAVAVAWQHEPLDFSGEDVE